MVASFFAYLKYEKRYSNHTLIAYEIDLNQLLSYLKTTYDTEDLTKVNYQILRSWILSLASDEIKPRTVARKIACIKSLFKFLHKSGSIRQNPSLKLLSPKLEKRLPAYIEEKGMDYLQDVSFESDGFEGVRDKVILELLYGTGIRLSELIGLKEGDFSKYNKTIKVLGKGNKERIIPINNELYNLINQYIQLKNSFFENRIDYLLVTDKGEKLYPMFVQRMVKDKLTNPEVTSIEKKSPHILRHTFATHLLNRGANLTAIKDLLGHSSLAATQVYTHNSIEKLKQAFEKAHPKA